jgi:predicted RND superfamily exporter protein
MVLAVGIGVDYAFYIYNRLQLHLGQGESIYQAMEKALAFEAMATIFTAITLAAGVVTWSFSPLKFQADMGKLLAFMFIALLSNRIHPTRSNERIRPFRPVLHDAVCEAIGY